MKLVRISDFATFARFKGLQYIKTFNKLPLSYINNCIHFKTFDLWQKQWDSSIIGRLCHKFIPDIAKFYNKHLNTNFLFAQLLTGHGNFNAYLKRFALNNEDLRECGTQEIQNTEHYLFNCDKFLDERRQLERSTIMADSTGLAIYRTSLKIKNSLRLYRTSLPNLQLLKCNSLLAGTKTQNNHSYISGQLFHCSSLLIHYYWLFTEMD